jgi:hypothetical protein
MAASSTAHRAGRVLCGAEGIEVEGSDGEQAVLGNAEVPDSRLFGERSRPAEISRFQVSAACRDWPDVRGHQVEGLTVGHSPGEGEAASSQEGSRDRTKYPQHVLAGEERAG